MRRHRACFRTCPSNPELFRDDTALQACLVKDTAHIVKGARGSHVEKNQTALGIIEGAPIDSDELSASFYGPATSPDALRANATRSVCEAREPPGRDT